MGTIGFGQVIVISLLMLLVFGDVTKLSEKIKSGFSNTRHEKKTGKKGVEPLTFGFGNHCSTN